MIIIMIIIQIMTTSTTTTTTTKLAVGNFMRGGAHRGQAEGFTLESLLLMANTKGCC